MNPELDEELPARLTELADSASTPIDGSVMSTIRGRAATQGRHRRGAALAVAAVVLAGGIGATALLPGPPSRSAPPATGPTSPPSTAKDLLDWPARGQKVADPQLTWGGDSFIQLQKVWLKEGGISGWPRLLYADGDDQRTIVIAEGVSNTGQARLGVFIGTLKDAKDPSSIHFRLGTDVVLPQAKPQVLLITLTGLAPRSEPNSTSSNVAMTIALIAPTAPTTQLTVTIGGSQTRRLPPPLGSATLHFAVAPGPSNRKIFADHALADAFKIDGPSAISLWELETSSTFTQDGLPRIAVMAASS